MIRHGARYWIVAAGAGLGLALIGAHWPAPRLAAVQPISGTAARACYLPGDGTCGPYSYSRITNSNGYNTYVGNQMWGCGTPGSCGPQTLTAYGPDRWSVTSTQRAGGTAVLSYPDVQQLFNDWTGRGWNGPLQPGQAVTDTPVSALRSLQGTYAESMGANVGTAAQAAYDIWTSSGEAMIWTDATRLRGTGGAVKAGAGRIGGRPFTLYLYGGPHGLPIIKLDAALRQGTVDILDGLRWLQRAGHLAPNATISQVNFGWEICSTGGRTETFRITRYALTAAAR